jgi:hypothetical protein
MHELSERIGQYYYIAEMSLMKVCHLPDFKAHYNTEYKTWMEGAPLSIPQQDNEEERKKYFEACNEICNMNATTPSMCI